jgi:hypothetical protein
VNASPTAADRIERYAVPTPTCIGGHPAVLGTGRWRPPTNRRARTPDPLRW